MFISLLKLCEKNPKKTPREDFNTESFAWILFLYPEVLNKFTGEFLKLPDDKYQVETQKLEKGLDGKENYIDLVMKGEKNICFIENKIESGEGPGQLKKYGEVLNSNYSDYEERYLFYCTKYSEPKNENGELGNGYHFNQFKWYEVAKFLKQFNENPLINDYIEFLKINGMEQDNTFKINNLLALENLNKSLEIAEFHIDNVIEEFKKRFDSTSSYKKSSFNWTRIKKYQRICHHREDILKNGKKSGYSSEVLYSIQLETLELNVQLYVIKDHEKIREFNEIDVEKFNKIDVTKNPDLKMEKWKMEKGGSGTSILKRKPLGDFLNDENSDKSIKEWFTQSFKELSDLMKSNPQLDWNYKENSKDI